jgi:hypothetical protein
MLLVSLAPLTLLAVSLLVATHDSSAPSDGLSQCEHLGEGFVGDE